MGFFWIGARSFGGVMPWAYRTMVEERRWLTHADFTETIGLCQFLPGPNIGNASIVLGKRWFGLRGSIVAALGLYALPFVWVLALAAIKMGRPLAKKPAALVLIVATFLAVAVARLSLLYVMPLALLIAYFVSRR